jgi:hypothetical protein
MWSSLRTEDVMLKYVNVIQIWTGEAPSPVSSIGTRGRRAHRCRKPTAVGFLRPPSPLRWAVAAARGGAKKKRWRSQPLLPYPLFSESLSFYASFASGSWGCWSCGGDGSGVSRARSGPLCNRSTAHMPNVVAAGSGARQRRRGPRCLAARSTAPGQPVWGKPSADDYSFGLSVVGSRGGLQIHMVLCPCNWWRRQRRRLDVAAQGFVGNGAAWAWPRWGTRPSPSGLAPGGWRWLSSSGCQAAALGVALRNAWVVGKSSACLSDGATMVMLLASIPSLEASLKDLMLSSMLTA